MASGSEKRLTNEGTWLDEAGVKKPKVEPPTSSSTTPTLIDPLLKETIENLRNLGKTWTEFAAELVTALDSDQHSLELRCFYAWAIGMLVEDDASFPSERIERSLVQLFISVNKTVRNEVSLNECRFKVMWAYLMVKGGFSAEYHDMLGSLKSTDEQTELQMRLLKTVLYDAQGGWGHHGWRWSGKSYQLWRATQGCKSERSVALLSCLKFTATPVDEAAPSAEVGDPRRLG